MYKIEVNQTVCLIVKLLYYLGIWQDEEEPAFRRIAKKAFYILYPVLFFIFLAIDAFFSYSSGNKNESIFVVQLVMTVKIMYLLFKKEELLAFLFDPIVAHSTEDRMEWQQINNKMTKFTKFINAYLFMILITQICNIVFSLPIIYGDKMLPLCISFPGQFPEIIYWILYAFISTALLCCSATNLITVLIWYIMLSYSIEYEVLGNQFRNLGKRMQMKTITKKKLEKKSQPTPRNLFVQDLIRLIKAHRSVYEYEYKLYS